MIHCALRMLDSAHLHLRQPLFVGQQLHIDIQYFAKVEDTLLNGRITHHGVTQYHRIRLFDDQLIESVFVRGSSYRSVNVQYNHIGQLDTYIVLIHHISVNARSACMHHTRARTQQNNVYYF